MSDEYDAGYDSGYEAGKHDMEQIYSTPIQSMKDTIERLRASNALICELVLPHLKEDVAERIRRHAYSRAR